MAWAAWPIFSTPAIHISNAHIAQRSESYTVKEHDHRPAAALT